MVDERRERRGWPIAEHAGILVPGARVAQCATIPHTRALGTKMESGDDPCERTE